MHLMQETGALSLNEFVRQWSGTRNLPLDGASLPFRFRFPAVADLVDILRADEAAWIRGGVPGPVFDDAPIRSEFRQLSLDQAMETPFQLSHYHLERFYGRGLLLDGFEETVMVPWRQLLAQLGFTWSRMKPYLYVSGRHCSTNYHADVSNILVWQICGEKTFSSLRDPEAHAPIEQLRRKTYRERLRKPESLSAADVIEHRMTAGSVLWNALLTPHWVDAADEVACTMLISHGGLRLRGILCPHEQRLEEWLHAAHQERNVFHRASYH